MGCVYVWVAGGRGQVVGVQRPPTTCLGRLPDGGPQSIENGVVEAGEPPEPASQSQRAAARQPAGAGCRTAARRVQKMVQSKPASSPLAAALQPAAADSWTAASRVQKMAMSKLVSPPHATALQPTEACCRTAASSEQKNGVVEAGKPPAPVGRGGGGGASFSFPSFSRNFSGQMDRAFKDSNKS
jgi:hypothetical protein